MEFLSSPGAFWAWLVELGVTEGMKYFLFLLLLAAARSIKSWVDRLRTYLPTLGNRLLRRPRRLPKTPRKLTAAERISIRESRGWIRSAFRRMKAQDAEWIVKYRFDQVWIDRERSRGHTCFVIMILWFGIWVLALGLKEVVFLPEGPLSASPGKAASAALPMYLFEFAWLRFSGRASRLIKYRNKVRIWRWRH